MTLNGIMALILRYFTEFGSFRDTLRKSGWRCRRKKFTFTISSTDECLVYTCDEQSPIRHAMHWCSGVERYAEPI